MNEGGTPSLASETRLDALADELASLNGLFVRRWESRDEWSRTLREIVCGEQLEPEEATYLASALSDLCPCPKDDQCKQN